MTQHSTTPRPAQHVQHSTTTVTPTTTTATAKIKHNLKRNLACLDCVLSGGPSLFSLPSRAPTSVPFQCASAPAVAGLGGLLAWALYKNTKLVNSVGFPVEQSTGHIHTTTKQQQGQLNQDMTPPTVKPKPLPLHPTAKLPTTATTATQQNTQHKLTTPTNRLQQPPHTHVAMTRGGRCLGSHSNVG
jgi:hypothetical protein